LRKGCTSPTHGIRRKTTTDNIQIKASKCDTKEEVRSEEEEERGMGEERRKGK
jgi:hypothetical protein